ncbi:MAG: hypothetical protein U9Q98_04565 [Bacteroidota bacterium]|nr:hypothetical protein [Bacteroidota bacterium]
MKTNLFILSFIIPIFSIGFLSCDLSDKISYPIKYKGKFLSLISEKNDLFIQYENLKDSVYEYFILQKDVNDFPKIGEISELYLYEDGFYVNAESTWYFYGLKEVEELHKLFVDSVENENVTHGFGVGHNITELDDSKTISSMQRFIEGYYKSHKCESGGEGATKCSTSAHNNNSSCSVSCSDGYYACCYIRMGTAYCECR